MNSKILEICAFSLDACIIAEKAGANRIELCAAPGEGGTTPSLGLMKIACQMVSIPIVALIRPRGGDFNYSAEEFEIMKYDILMAKEAGCKGIALGILNDDNSIDINRTKELVKLSHPLPVTFIRAFDLTPNPTKAVLDIIETGCKRILTSGQRLRAESNIPLLQELISIAGDKIIIMPGSGITDKNLPILMSHLNTTEFHSSARISFSEDNLSTFGFGVSVSCSPLSIQNMTYQLNAHFESLNFIHTK